MVKVIQRFVPSYKYGTKCPFTRIPQFIVMHNTGNEASAKNEVSYMTNNNNQVSFHVAIDDQEIIETIPFDRNAWASGDGRGEGNMYGIHIEICYSTEEDPTRFLKAEKNAAEYVAYLLKKYNWGLDKIKKHQDFDGKYCPHHTLNLGWDRFKKMVESCMVEPKKEEEIVTKEEWEKFSTEHYKETAAKKPSDWAKESWNKVISAGIMDGTMPRSPLTREQFATVLNRLGLLDKE